MDDDRPGIRQKLWEFWQSHSALILTLISVASLALLYIALVFEDDFPRESQFASRVATVVLTGVLVQILLRYLVWREAEERIRQHLGIRDEIHKSGFQAIKPFDEIDWGRLFSSCDTIEMFFISNTTWVKTHVNRIKTFLSSPNHSIDLVLRNPDPESLQFLAERFSENPDKRSKGIIETAKTLRDAYADIPGKERGRLNILQTSLDPTYTYYRFGNTAIFVPYKLRLGRAPGEIPAFFFDTSGTAYKHFLKEDFKYLLEREGAQPWTEELLGVGEQDTAQAEEKVGKPA